MGFEFHKCYCSPNRLAYWHHILTHVRSMLFGSFTYCASLSLLLCFVHVGSHRCASVRVCVYPILNPSLSSVCLHYQQVQKTGSCFIATNVSPVFPFIFPTTSIDTAHAREFSHFPLGKCYPSLMLNFILRSLQGTYSWAERKLLRKMSPHSVSLHFAPPLSLSLWVMDIKWNVLFFHIFSLFWLAKWFTTMPWMIQIHRLIERKNINNNSSISRSSSSNNVQPSRLTAI